MSSETTCNNMKMKIFAPVPEFDSDVEDSYKTEHDCSGVEERYWDWDQDWDYNDLWINRDGRDKIDKWWAALDKEMEMRQWEVDELKSFGELVVSRKVEDVSRPPLPSNEELDKAYKEYCNMCAMEDEKKAKKEEYIFCLCMNKLYDVNRPLFKKIASGDFEGRWYPLYERAMKAEATRKRLASEEEYRQAQKRKEEERRELLVRKGVCKCAEDAEECTCAAPLYRSFYVKRKKKKLAKAAKRKEEKEAQKKAKELKLKVEARKAFLEKKDLEKKRWKESLAYQDALRKKKQREESGNVILQKEESDSEMEKLEDDSSLEEDEKNRKIEEHLLFKEEERNAQFDCFMDEIVKHEEKVKIEEAAAKAKAEDEKTWTVQVRKKRKKRKKSGKAIEKKKKEVKKRPKVVSLDNFMNTRSCRRCTLPCKSVRRQEPCSHIARGNVCRYAHTVDELIITPCRHRFRCKKGAKCPYWHKHEGETEKTYLRRHGFQTDEKKTMKQRRPSVSSEKKSRPRRRWVVRPIRRSTRRWTRRTFREVLLGLNKPEDNVTER